METIDCRHMFVIHNGTSYVASTTPPDQFKKKAMYFLKKENVKLTPDNLIHQVTFGDLSAAPLETLSLLAQEIYGPMISHPGNHKGLPDMVSKEIMESF